MVNPGGTERAAFVISARTASLPPSSSFIFPLPSALPSPKKYTYFTALAAVCGASVSGSVVVLICLSLSRIADENCYWLLAVVLFGKSRLTELGRDPSAFLLPLLPFCDDLGEIGDS